MTQAAGWRSCAGFLMGALGGGYWRLGNSVQLDIPSQFIQSLLAGYYYHDDAGVDGQGVAADDVDCQNVVWLLCYYCPSLMMTLPPLEWMVRFVPPVVLIMPVEAEPSLGSKVIP